MTPPFPQEIHLLGRYGSADYLEKLRDAFAGEYRQPFSWATRLRQ